MSNFEQLSPEKQKKLIGFVHTSLLDYQLGSPQNYERLVSELDFTKKNVPASAFRWFHVLCFCVGKINSKVHKDLMDILFRFPWSYPENVLKKYSVLLLRFISSDGTLTKRILEVVIPQFEIYVKTEDEGKEILESPKYAEKCKVIHSFLKDAKHLRPDVPTLLFPILLKSYPGYKCPVSSYRAYLLNIFGLLTSFPELRYRCLQFLLEKVSSIDQSLNKMEESQNLTQNFKHWLEILDVTVQLILDQLTKMVNENPQDLQKTWTFILSIFERTVLKQRTSRHVQFIMFYFCQFQMQFAVGFAKQLVKISTEPSTPALIRKASLLYVGGFIARAKYVRLRTVCWTIDMLLQWTGSYVKIFEEKIRY
eukprot:UN05019